VLGVATFYHLFRFDPPGDHTCTVCTGTACFVKGADALLASVGEAFDVPLGGTKERPLGCRCSRRAASAAAAWRRRRWSTASSPRRRPSGSWRRCGRRVATAPAAEAARCRSRRCRGRGHGPRAERGGGNHEVDLFDIAHKEREEQGAFRTDVLCCGSTACLAGGAQRRDRRGPDRRGEKPACRERRAGGGHRLHGDVLARPAREGAHARREDVLYADVDADRPRIATSTSAAGKPVEEAQLPLEHPFFARQIRVVLENMGEIDPNRIEDYIAQAATARCATRSPP
jgi:hypothetical protein